MEVTARPLLVFVHSPLVGPSTWTAVAERLGSRYPVVTPSLTGVFAKSGDPGLYHALADAVALPVPDTGEPVVLVAHSGAGALLPVVAERLGDRVRAAVYVDALPPHPGSRWLDTVPQELRDHLLGLAHNGLLPPWNEWFPPEVLAELLPEPGLREKFVVELPRVPVTYLAEPAPSAAEVNPAAYLRLSEGYDEVADEAERRGWWVRRRQYDHLAPLTRPGDVAALVDAAVTALDVGTGPSSAR
ncbi:alpha/beta hydrolase [Saccharomonospora viridis]|jgi:pimeloyl-ACP methyl ester carboxylesterase|uniref:alpha/beta hydrolase n=1 Tax=Saccharomonospora viridis TaxID=1852 RepID=UPI0024A829CF|nr:alpha/beta hydrolase [Saccharomonospora viridis]